MRKNNNRYNIIITSTEKVMFSATQWVCLV